MSLPNQQPHYRTITSRLKPLAISTSFLLLFGCNTTSLTSESNARETAKNDCIGTTEQHAGLKLLPNEKLPPGVVMPQQQGGLCEGQVFVTTKEITIWRAWNSEYSGSKLGKWWTFDKPRGSISQYRCTGQANRPQPGRHRPVQIPAFLPVPIRCVSRLKQIPGHFPNHPAALNSVDKSAVHGL